MLEKLFSLSANRTSAKTEIIARITTFLASMYIIVVNPSVLSQSGMPFNGVLTATIIVSAFCSVMMGIYANNPILAGNNLGISELDIHQAPQN